MNKKKIGKVSFPLVLLICYLAFWILLAINPRDRTVWLLENVLAFFAVPLFIWTYYKFRFSNVAYFCIFIFMMLHTLGAHYTYSNVPFGSWIQDYFGLARNHYDRLVHFSFGLLMIVPIREFFLKIAKAKGIWSYYLPFSIIVSFSAFYEVGEWLTEFLVGPAKNLVFLGTQGDIWDASKDMFLATFGSMITLIVMFIGKAKHKTMNWKERIKKGFAPI
ncbi:DUF2238 domain-containing protein [Candidatus Pacearchaeota archaeon]|nr:DUF2238 domain-containing protein [Candidatus Pacearchaeota archaeon]